MKLSAGLFVLLTVLQFHPTNQDPDTEIPGHVEDFRDGDVLIGFIYKSDVNGAIGTTYLLSFLAAIENEAYFRIPGPENYKVGYVIWTAPFVELDLDFVTQMLHSYPKIVALIGLPSNSMAEEIYHYVDDLRIPTYVVASLGIAFDRVKESSAGQEYLTQITSKKSTQVLDTIPEILQKLGANVITVVYEQETELLFSELNIVLSFHGTKIDIESNIRLNKLLLKPLVKDASAQRRSGSEFDFESLEAHFEHMEGIAEEHEHRVHTVVLLLKSGSHYRAIVQWLLAQDKIRDMVLIGDTRACLRTGSKSYVEGMRTLSKRNVFVYRLCQTSFQDSELKDFISNYQLYRYGENGDIIIGNKHIDMMYKNDSAGDERCLETNTCTSMMDYSNFENFQSSYTYRIFHGTKKILRALQKLTSTQIDEVSKRSFVDLILNKSSVGKQTRAYFRETGTDEDSFLSFSGASMIEYFDVLFEEPDSTSTVRWSSDEQENAGFEPFMKETRNLIMSQTGLGFSCSTPCKPGHKTLVGRRYFNCWKCIPCSGNTVAPASKQPQGYCDPCNSTELPNPTHLWANPGRTECTTPARSVNPGTQAGKVLVAMATINLAILAFTIGVYITYWKNRVIASSGREFSSIMLIGLIIGHTEAILIAMEPTRTICVAIQILSHIFMMLTVVPLTVKTYRIWIVFKFSIKLGSKLKNYISRWVLMLTCGVLMLPQVACLVLGFLLDQSHDFGFRINYVEESDEASFEHPIVVTKSCGPGSFTLMLASIVYTGALLLISTALGWGCRKVPDNFKESMHIFVCSLISLLLVTIYVPAMLTMAGFTQVALLAGVISIISLTLNVVIFLPKIYVVLFVSAEQQKALCTRASTATIPRPSVGSQKKSSII